MSKEVSMDVLTPSVGSDLHEAGPHASPERALPTGVPVPLRVLMLAWELPSVTGTGVGVPGEGLVAGLRELGAEIVLLLGGRDGTQAETWRQTVPGGRLRILTSFPPWRRREAARSRGEQLLDEVSRLSSVARIVAGEDRFGLIHAHDWMTFPAAVAARDASGAPFLAHVHATEFARNAGLADPAVTRLEGEGLRRADRVICASSVTASVVRRRYRVPEARIRVVSPSIAGGGLEPAARCLEIYRELA
jgi:glycosyltransferase involved in cell wall biosynthesis